MFTARNNPAKNRSTDFLPGLSVAYYVGLRKKAIITSMLFECTVDKWRVVLKGENPDYINASSIHVSHLSMHVYLAGLRELC